MVKIGDYNTLLVSRKVDFGFFLDAGNGVEILLPAKYVPDGVRVGDQVDVFVYNDSEDRLIATTERPYATVGKVAYLEVSAVNRIGAFLDWGLIKDLLVPFSEQKLRMVQGRKYPVYIYLDDATKRVVASAKIEKFIGNLIPKYHVGDTVEAFVYKHTPIGYSCAVDNLHQGMIYENEIYAHLAVGDMVNASVVRVRADGKIDLRFGGSSPDRVKLLADNIQRRLIEAGGILPFGDSSSPDVLHNEFQCSKKDFKKAVGYLLKNSIIEKSTSTELHLIDKWAEM